MGEPCGGGVGSPGLVGRDKSTVSREIRPNGRCSPVAGRMWCYRTAHRPRQEPAQGAAVPPPALVGRSPALGAGGPAWYGNRHRLPPGADRGPHHDPCAPTRGAGGTTIYRAVHSGLGDHTLGGHNKDEARLRPQEAPQEGPSRRAGQDRSPTSWASGPPSPTGVNGRADRLGGGGTVAGRMSGAVLVTPARPGHQVVPGGRPGPPPNARRTSHCSIEQALAPHTAAPSPWTGATSSPPGPRPSRITGRPPLLLPGPLPLAARHQ